MRLLLITLVSLSLAGIALIVWLNRRWLFRNAHVDAVCKNARAVLAQTAPVKTAKILRLLDHCKSHLHYYLNYSDSPEFTFYPAGSLIPTLISCITDLSLLLADNVLAQTITLSPRRLLRLTDTLRSLLDFDLAGTDRDRIQNALERLHDPTRPPPSAPIPSDLLNSD